MPISPFWTPIDDMAETPRARVPMRPEDELEPLPEDLPPAPPPARPEPLAPRNAESVKMRDFMRKRYPQEFEAALGDFESTRIRPEDLTNQRERAAGYGFLGALSEASAGIGNLGGKATATNVPEYMEGIQKRESEAISGRGRLADSAFRRMDAAATGMDALDAGDQADARRPYEDADMLRRSESSTLDLEGKRRGAADQASKSDPNSEVSKTMRSLARDRWKRVFGSDLPENISATALEKYMPEVAKEYGSIMDREFRAGESKERRAAQARHDEMWTRGRNEDRRSREDIAAEGRAAREAEAAAKRAAGVAPKPLGTEDKKRLDFAREGIVAIRGMESALAGGDWTRSATSNDFTNNLDLFAEAYGRMQSGGAINADEEKRFKRLAPGPLDSPEMQKNKMTNMRKVFMDRAKTILGDNFNPDDFAHSADGNANPDPTAPNSTPAPKTRRVWKPGG